MNYNFQVVLMDNKGYIKNYQDFKWNEKQTMIKYIARNTDRRDVNKIEITRWNIETGERE